MIRDIWIRIAALLALAVLPIMVLQLKLQQDSISLVYDLADKTAIRPTLDTFLTQLREDARSKPEMEAVFKDKFLKASETKRSLEEFFLAQASIDRDIRLQPTWISLIVLAFSILGSIWISKGIVVRVQQLIAEREKASAKLRDLNALQNWQGVAKILVHELRAPITPIKLVATDLNYKYQTLTPDSFGRYLLEAQTLVNEQIEAIETMIGGFTAFGKLPDPELRKASLSAFISEFAATYGRSFGEGVSLQVQSLAAEIKAQFDTKLLRDLLFNLSKNAAEANEGNTTITLSLVELNTTILLTVHNTGAAIPEGLRRSLFDPYVSTKSGTNMGLGLAIARKIALDHGGDLQLAQEDGPTGVRFNLELPRAH